MALAYVVYLGGLVVAFAAVAEYVARRRGLRPWRQTQVSIRVEPGGKLYRTHPTLGYQHIPGSFAVTLDTGYTFNVTHRPDTLRITAPPGVARPRAERPVWVFGCSFTHGWSLQDDETYPWLLQQRFPEREVVNFGVGGYGTIQSLLQFRSALEKETPAAVVLAYAAFHDERNTFSRLRRKQVAPWNRLGPVTQPFARLNGAGELEYRFADVEYRELPLMRRSALVHFLEKQFNLFEAQWHDSHAVSEALVREMAALSRQRGVTFVVADIMGGGRMLDFAARNGIPGVDIAVDLEIPENTNRPHDSHPSASANRHYADALERFLRGALR